MNILVTGGAGFIGSHTVRRLLETNQNIIGLDNFTGFLYNPEIKEKNIRDFLNKENFKLYRADLRDKEKLLKIFSENKINLIIHLAAMAGVRPSIANPQLYYDVNVNGTLNLLDLAKEFGIKNFIFASSSSVYGNNKKVPFSETDNVDNPISPYAASKKAGELICYTYYKLYSIAMTCLRFFTVYGPSGRPDMAPYKFTKLVFDKEEIPMYGDGSSARDYTYIDDIVEGILRAIDFNLQKVGYEIFNLGNSRPIKLLDFIHLIEEISGQKAKIKKLPTQPGDVKITFADIKKAQKYLGYQPKIKIEEGMERFIKWYKKNLELKT